jgi:hypothetical protein
MSDDNTANKNYYRRLAQEHAELDDQRGATSRKSLTTTTRSADF